MAILAQDHAGLLLLVLLIAGLFGVWNEWKRRNAVNELIGRLSSSRIQLMPTLAAAEPFWLYHRKRIVAVGAFGPQVRRIRDLHAEPIAVEVLVRAILNDPDDQIRVESVLSLGEIARPDQRLPEILAAVQELARNDPGVQGVAELAIRRLRSSRQHVESRARLLPQLDPEARERFLEKEVADEAREVRWWLQ